MTEGRSFHNVARWLYSNLDNAVSSGEEFVRTIVGRAYYAILLELRKKSRS